MYLLTEYVSKYSLEAIGWKSPNVIFFSDFI